MFKRSQKLVTGEKIILLISAILFFSGSWNNTLHQSGREPSVDNHSNSASGYLTGNQYKIDILHYDLSIDLYPEENILKGEAVLKGIFTDKNIYRLDLNFYDNLLINSVELNGEETSFERAGTRLSIPYEPKNIDTFYIKIIYEGTPKRRGLSSFVFGEINNKSVVYNLNEPNFASTWFPCNDMPDDKALLDIKITNDSSKVSVSNGKLINITSKNGRKTYHWKTYYPISTYLICVYSSEYKNFNDYYVSLDEKDTMEIKYYVLPEHENDAKIDFKSHPKIISFFAKTFGEYPFIKEKYGVAEFLWQLGAMEHQTITGIGSNFVGGNNFFEDIYVHELAHHWWGNAVGPATWKDIWLNEGFSTYSEALYAEHKNGKIALQSKMLSKYQDNFTGTLYNPGDFLFSQTIYDKGAWVLHMLRWEVGDSVFFNILRNYFETFKYKNASTEDFKKIAEQNSGKNLTDFFDQWVYKGEGNIELNYEWKTEKDEDKYLTTLYLKQVQNEYDIYKFPLEISLKLKNDVEELHKIYIDKKEVTLTLKTESEPQYIILDPDNWLLMNSNFEK